jgi:hypothetical protein
MLHPNQSSRDGIKNSSARTAPLAIFHRECLEKSVRRNADIAPFFRDRFATLLQNIEETLKKRAIAAGFIFSFCASYEFMSDDF